MINDSNDYYDNQYSHYKLIHIITIKVYLIDFNESVGAYAKLTKLLINNTWKYLYIIFLLKIPKWINN